MSRAAEASPDDLKRELSLLKLELQEHRRLISPQQRAALIAALKRYPTSFSVPLYFASSDPEAEDYARQFVASLAPIVLVPILSLTLLLIFLIISKAYLSG